MTKTNIWLPLMLAVSLAACSDNNSQQQEQEQEQQEQPNTLQAEQPTANESGITEGDTDGMVASGGLEGPQGDLAEQSEALRQQIRDIAEQPVANSIAQCRVVGIGSKPCGGPESYILYSTQNTDESKLMPVVEQYNSVREMLNQKNDMVSDCAVIPEPGIALRSGFCVPIKQVEM